MDLRILRGGGQDFLGGGGGGVLEKQVPGNSHTDNKKTKKQKNKKTSWIRHWVVVTPQHIPRFRCLLVKGNVDIIPHFNFVRGIPLKSLANQMPAQLL